MKDFRIIVWKEIPQSKRKEGEGMMDDVINTKIKIGEMLYNLFNSLNYSSGDLGLDVDDKDYDDMLNLMKRMAHLVINKHFDFDEDDYYFDELYVENDNIYCEIVMN